MPVEPDSPPVEVVAGVIRDTRGRILLARRTAGRDLAGLWEFPGGKREPGESPEAALARELHEELGIDAEVGEPLITVPQAYPTKRLRLDVRAITRFRGTARGRENQALAWVPPHRLASYPMPPADRPVVAALQQPAHYLVTPEPCAGEASSDDAWLDGLRRALASGISRVQLRSHTAPRERWQALVAAAVALCREADAEVLLNGDIHLARTHGTGLHLRAAQLADLRERPIGPDAPLSASCHRQTELQAAEAIGCDFAVLGSIAATPSHPDGQPIGWPGFAALREHVSLPIYAIGGLGPDDLADARQHGAQGIAAIRALWPGPQSARPAL